MIILDPIAYKINYPKMLFQHHSFKHIFIKIFSIFLNHFNSSGIHFFPIYII